MSSIQQSALSKHPSPHLHSAAASVALNSAVALLAPHGAPQRTAAHHGAPSKSTNHHESKPTSPPPIENQKSKIENPLTERQSAALRLLLVGHSPCSVASTLNIDRHTLLRWRRQPAFLAEFNKLHNQLVGRTLLSATDGCTHPSVPLYPTQRATDLIAKYLTPSAPSSALEPPHRCEADSRAAEAHGSLRSYNFPPSQ